jgi:hypothetical protein
MIKMQKTEDTSKKKYTRIPPVLNLPNGLQAEAYRLNDSRLFNEKFGKRFLNTKPRSFSHIKFHYALKIRIKTEIVYLVYEWVALWTLTEKIEKMQNKITADFEGTLNKTLEVSYGEDICHGERKVLLLNGVKNALPPAVNLLIQDPSKIRGGTF